MMVSRASFSVFVVLALSCGGSKASSTPGVSHSTLDTGGGAAPPGPGEPDAGVVEPVGPPPPVMFVLKNSGSENLVLNMDKGWQSIIYAYSGQTPNAKSILMFPTHCTAACDVPKEEVCPYCPEPEKLKDIKAAEQHDHVLPGDAREVPWDTKIFVYKKTKGITEGKKTRCKCYEVQDVPPEEYTVKACGLRLTKTAEERSKYQCVTGTMTLPSEEPLRVELDFGDPE